MSIYLTDEIEVKTKKGKMGAAKQIFLEGDTQTVEKEIQDINSRHNDLSSTVSGHTKQIESNQNQIAANKSAQDEKNTSLDANMAKLNTRDDQITELVKGVTATGGASVATAVTYDNTSSNLDAATVQGAVDELQGSKINKTSILQELGEAEDKVMSQKAVSDKLSDLGIIDIITNKKVNQANWRFQSEKRPIKYIVGYDILATITNNFDKKKQVEFRLVRKDNSIISKSGWSFIDVNETKTFILHTKEQSDEAYIYMTCSDDNTSFVKKVTLSQNISDNLMCSFFRGKYQLYSYKPIYVEKFNNQIYFKLQGDIHLRNYENMADYSMSDIFTDIKQQPVLSPQGKEDCAILEDASALVFNIENRVFNTILRTEVSDSDIIIIAQVGGEVIFTQLSNVILKVKQIEDSLTEKLDKSALTQELGDSEDKVVSQKVTNGIENRLYFGYVSDILFNNVEYRSLKSDGTYYGPINNGYITDFVEIPSNATKVVLKDAAIITAGYAVSCPFVLYEENKSTVAGYVLYKENNVRGTFIADIPTNAKYVRFCCSLKDGLYAKPAFVYPFNTPIEDKNDIISLHNENEQLPLLQSINLPSYNHGFKTKPLVLLHVSDIHGSNINLARILQYKQYYSSYIDDILNTGDSTKNSSTEDISTWYYSLSGATKVLQTIGNHDGATYVDNTYNWTGFGRKNTYDRYIAPITNEAGINQPNNADELGLNYWYKDYSSKGIRLIGLDVMFYDDEQNDWLIEKLNEAKTLNLAVIVAAHFTGDSVTGFDCKFSSIKGNIDNQYNYYGDYAKNLYKANEAIDSFINSKGQFVCWLCGHTHYDLIGTCNNHPNQIVITVSTGQYSCGINNGIPEEAHIYGTPSQDSFNIVGIDVYSKMIKLYKVGAMFDNLLRRKSELVVSYDTKKLICEN